MRYGVAPGVRRALIGKVIGKERSATTTELAVAVDWAVKQGAYIINMSLGFDFPGLVQEWVEVMGKEEVDLATSRALAQYRDNLRFFDGLAHFQRVKAKQGPGALIVAAARNESKRHTMRATDGLQTTITLGSVKPHGQAFALELALEVSLPMPRQDEHLPDQIEAYVHQAGLKVQRRFFQVLIEKADQELVLQHRHGKAGAGIQRRGTRPFTSHSFRTSGTRVSCQPSIGTSRSTSASAPCTNIDRPRVAPTGSGLLRHSTPDSAMAAAIDPQGAQGLDERPVN